MKIPSKLPQFQASPSLFIAGGELEAHFYLAKNGTISMQGSVMLSSLRPSLDPHKEFYSQAASQLRELLAELPVKSMYIFAPHHVAFGIFGLLSGRERALIRDIVFGEFIRMHPFGLALALEERIAAK